MTDWKKVIKNIDRYKDFEILDKPIPFSEFAKDKDWDLVQVHSTQVINIGEIESDDTHTDKYDILGFCGAFSWRDNTLQSLDGDTYNENMLVLGYNEFQGFHTVDTVSNRLGLDILVGDDW